MKTKVGTPRSLALAMSLRWYFEQAVGEEERREAREAWEMHEGSPVKEGSPKIVMRTDVLFRPREEVQDAMTIFIL